MWPEAIEFVFKIKLDDFRKCLETIKRYSCIKIDSVITKRRTSKVEISSYFSHRKQINLNNSALTPTIPPSAPKKSVESNKISKNLITPSLNKKNTLSVIKPHSSKFSTQQREIKSNKHSNTSEVSKKTTKNFEKDCEEILKSKTENPKPISINLALKKVYNANNSCKNSCCEVEKNKKKQKISQINKLTVIINEYKSNEIKNNEHKKKTFKNNRQKEKSSNIIFDLSKNKDVSLVNISLNQITNSNSGILTNRTARVDLKNYQSLNGGCKALDIIHQNTTKAESRKFSFSKLDHFSSQKKYTSTIRESKYNYTIPKSFKIDLNEIGNEIIKKIKI